MGGPQRRKRAGASRASARGGGLTGLLRRTDLNPLQPGGEPPAGFESVWHQRIRHRSLLLIFVLACLVAGLEVQLVRLQVFQHETLAAQAQAQQESRIAIEAPRGDILDRDGRLLSYSIEAQAIYATPAFVEDPAEAITRICGVLACTADDRAVLAERLSSERPAVVVRRARDLTAAEVADVRALGLPGLYFPREVVRVHPHRETAAHVVGFTRVTRPEGGREYTIGGGGLEHAFDAELQGRDGSGITVKTGGRQPQRLQTRVVTEPRPGASVELTLDLELQAIVERELEAGVRANRAAGGSAVVLDPRTGEVLAMASYPGFNPNRGGALASRANPAVGYVYEPGSTFKIVTASAALEEGVLTPGSVIDTAPGRIRVPGRSRAISDVHEYGELTFEDVIVKSSNVGAVKAGQRLGAERLADYVERFGFGRTISSDFSGESAGLWSPALTESGLASVSMGYQVSVTPLQMAAATNVIANGGVFLEPYIVSAVIRDGVREPVEHKAGQRVISRATAASMTRMMEGVVERGTATRARIDGYRVAGKTGTSNKAVPGGYSPTEYNASFVGFVPADQPAFTILVMIDSPHAGSHYGGVVAAPIFRAIADASLLHRGIPRSQQRPPALRVRAGAPVLPVRRVSSTAVIPVMSPAGGPAVMPDLRGLPARDALRAITAVGLTPRMGGTGFVVAQRPAPGAPIEPGSWASVELRQTGAFTPGDRSGNGVPR